MTTRLPPGWQGSRRHTATATRPCSSPTSCWASATAGQTGTPAGLDTYRRGRTFIHINIEPTQISRVFAPDSAIVSNARSALTLPAVQKQAITWPESGPSQ